MWWQFYRALRLSPLSFLVMLVTFLSTFFISIENGLLMGLASSVILVLYQLSHVRTPITPSHEYDEDRPTQTPIGVLGTQHLRDSTS